MKFNELVEHESQVLEEANKAQWARRGSVVGGFTSGAVGFALGASLGLPMLWPLYAASGLISGAVWGGVLGMLFAGGRQKQIWKSIPRQVKAIDKAMKSAKTTRHAKAVADKLNRLLDDLEELCNHVEMQTGTAGVFRSKGNVKHDDMLKLKAELEEFTDNVREQLRGLRVGIASKGS